MEVFYGECYGNTKSNLLTGSNLLSKCTAESRRNACFRFGKYTSIYQILRWMAYREFVES